MLDIDIEEAALAGITPEQIAKLETVLSENTPLCPRCQLRTRGYYRTGSLKPYCNQCSAEYLRNYRKTEKYRAYNNRFKVERPDYHRNKAYEYKYGISLSEYDRLYAIQNGQCAICRDWSERLVVDHSHTTNMIRGLLCKECNRLLGAAKDSTEVLANAIDYLKR